MLDEEPSRRQFALQEGTEAETGGHVWNRGERFSVRIRDADASEPQIELSGLSIDAEARPGNRNLHPAARPVHELLDKRGQPAQVDWPLRQTPKAEPPPEDQRRRRCTEPRQNAVTQGR